MKHYLEPSQEATLSAIYNWKEFTPDWAQRILDHLVNHPGPEGRSEREPAGIARALFQRNEPEDLNIPQRILRINEKLKRFFAGPGSALQWRVSIKTANRGKAGGDDHYEVVFEMAGEDVLRRFWAPHLLANVPTRFAYGEPLFSHDPNSLEYVRDVMKNEPYELEREEWVSYPFITLGDLRLLWEVGHYLRARGVHVESNGFRHESKLRDLQATQKARNENMLVLGTPRSNGMIGEYQKNYPFQFVVEDGAIAVRGAKVKRLKDRNLPNKTDSQVAYAVIGRRPGIQIGSVTIVASNNGRAIGSIGELLTSGVLLPEFVAREPKLSFFQEELPPAFQILLEFDLTDHGTFVQSYRVVDVWNPQNAALARSPRSRRRSG